MRCQELEQDERDRERGKEEGNSLHRWRICIRIVVSQPFAFYLINERESNARTDSIRETVSLCGYKWNKSELRIDPARKWPVVSIYEHPLARWGKFMSPVSFRFRNYQLGDLARRAAFDFIERAISLAERATSIHVLTSIIEWIKVGSRLCSFESPKRNYFFPVIEERTRLRRSLVITCLR